jgi:hypothetical protein
MCSKLGKTYLWSETRGFCAKLLEALPTQLHVHTQLRVCHAKTMTVHKNEQYTGGSWVVWNDAHANRHIGRVLNIIQFCSSDVATQGYANYVLLNKARVGHNHGIYEMPHVMLLEDQVLIRPEVSILSD